MRVDTFAYNTAISPSATGLATLRANDCPLNVCWADCEDDVREAQRLRYRVFAQEMGACLAPPAGTAPGIDADHFDAFCDHLLVRANGNDDGNDDGNDEDRGLLVGTYRVLNPAAARRAGSFYTDTEFDLSPLSTLRANAVELGRSCVHPAWRSGGVIMALWSALGRYMLMHRLDTMIGCASIALDHDGQSASQLWHRLQHNYLVAPKWRVQPRIALPIAAQSIVAQSETASTMRTSGRMTDTPPLIKGYLRCGARLLGPPALDTAFNTADLPMMLRLEDMAPRYRKHFLGP